MPAPPPSRGARARNPLDTLALWLGAAYAALAAAAFLWVAWSRIRWNFEIAYVENAILLGAARWREGLPYYVPPGPDFCAINFPPVFMGLIAALYRGFGLSYAAPRLLSTLATLASAGWVHGIVRRMGAARGVAMWVAGAYLHLYLATGAVFDAAMPDSLKMFFSLAALWCLVSGTARGRHVVAALLLTAAFFTKQSAVFYYPFAVLTVWRAAGWRRAAGIALLLAGLTGGIWLSAHLATGGWFTYYCFTLPMRHYRVTAHHRGMRERAWRYFAPMLVPWALALAIRIWRRAATAVGRRPAGSVSLHADVVAVAAWGWGLGGLIAMVRVRSVSGSEIHAELPFYAGALLLGACAATACWRAIERRQPAWLGRLGRLAIVLPFLWLAGCMPNTYAACRPRPIDRDALAYLSGRIEAWLARGDRVWVPHHSFFMKQRFGVDTPDLLGLADVVRYDAEVQSRDLHWRDGTRLELVMPAFYERLRHGDYDVIVRESRPFGSQDIMIAITRYYRKVERLWEAPHWQQAAGNRPPLQGTVNDMYPLRIVVPAGAAWDGNPPTHARERQRRNRRR